MLPLVTETENSFVFDNTIGDFVESRTRNTYSNTYDIRIPVNAVNNIAFVVDLFCSRQVELYNQKTQQTYAVKIKPKSDLLFNQQAAYIDAQLTLLDTDSLATPMAEIADYSALITGAGEYIQANDSNILI
jgi:hypothetical protein